MDELSVENEHVLYHMARSLLHDRDYGELLSHILDMTIQALKADRGCIVVRENGAGKELLARAIYRRSARAKGPFVVV